MKKSLIYPVLAGLLVTPLLNAQFIRNNTQQEMVEGWQNQSVEEEGVYGAAVDKAYELLNGKKPKKQVTVAIIGTGLDITHSDLKQSIWKNPKEKENGKDDDKNGYVDDLHGWNFLGNSSGEIIEKLSRVADREYFRLRDKYFGYYDYDGKYYQITEEGKQLEERPVPADLDEYNYFRYKVLEETATGRSEMGISMIWIMQSYIPEFDKLIYAAYPDGLITSEQFAQTVDTSSQEDDVIRQTAIALMGYAFMAKGNDWNAVRNFVLNEQLPATLASYQQNLASITINEREIIGDNPYDINDRGYGNNILNSVHAGSGTMQAGILAGNRTAGNVAGVNDQAKIMTLRIDADFVGEPYMKDMALAIRYAVDNGADIIQIDKTNTMYPMPQAGWVTDALLYAQSKGVLVVIPMMDLSFNLDNQPFYPAKNLPGNIELKNVITVAASDSKGNPLINTNFSETKLDVFAPGVDVKSTYIGDTYRTGTGSYLAASVVSGVASLLKSYYPALTPEQIRQLIIENVTDCSEMEVEKQYILFNNEGRAEREAKDLFLFSELCVSGGIVNAYKALQAAALVK